MGICHNKVTSNRAKLISNIDAETVIENNFNFNTLLVTPTPDVVITNNVVEEADASTDEINHKDVGKYSYLLQTPTFTLWI